MKQKVLAFDIDGVICNTLGSDYENSKPNKKVIEKIYHLYDAGNTIIVFTARFMGRTNNNYQEAYKLGYKFTLNQLQSWNLKFNELILGKPSFDLLIDDKAFNYNDSWIEKI